MSTSARAALISVVVLICVLAINLYIFSPWHTHGSFSKQLCSFSNFEHGNGTEASPAIQIVPPATLAWLPAGSDPALQVSDTCVHRSGRAPPA